MLSQLPVTCHYGNSRVKPVSSYFGPLSVFFLLLMGVMIAFGTQAYFWHPQHSGRESHTSAMCWLKKVPPYICFEPVSCLFYMMPLTSCIGRDGTAIPVHLLVGIHDFRARYSIFCSFIFYLFYRPVFLTIPLMAAILYH